MSTHTITANEMEAIATGGAFLGTGGGGDPYIGKLMAQAAIEQHGPVEVIAPEDVKDDWLCVPVCMMGAPTVMLEKLPAGDEANRALEQLEAFLGRKADALICIEAGGLNSTIPFAVAAATGLPLIDGDGMGRAFPELQMVSFTMQGVAATPMVIADEKGNSSVINAISNLWTERLARSQTIEMGGSALVALYPMSGEEVKRGILRHTLSLILDIGQVITGERGCNRNPATALIEKLNGKRLFSGRVIDIERKTEGGFARGRAVIKGMDEDQGRVFRVDFQNEFLIALDDDDKPLAVTPDLICALDADGGLPVTTEQLRYGLAVTMIGLPCDAQWRSPAGIELVGPGYFGYPQAYTPLEDLPL
ncbi:DUF917 domain-containing protein [Hoeflea prorocentri]|uniref:DUF917 domain-containing protein n=1 Tax=Hoeflea prorocentri TaxID=1922333 RepID=A0A9X3UIG3_9HYPH|nr:DUF917 domain-containing protein [Hoeflea prorocentri]MCY6381264.1 DUF917 domain-containing protein [Hoeflea prorocentri]MDA5399064.1 DUF917 domain-containing protein [Hoeflea prorocentri]